jgi:uncharacterized protein (DUF305 family)
VGEYIANTAVAGNFGKTRLHHLQVMPVCWEQAFRSLGEKSIEANGKDPAGRGSVNSLEMFGFPPDFRICLLPQKQRLGSATGVVTLFGMMLTASTLAGSCPFVARAQNANASTPVVVQPGAPGEPSKTLPSTTRGSLPPLAQADVDFMQGMIMHHQQAVEMTALIASHTENKDVRALGAKISSSQSDEIRFMQRWLAGRGQATSMPGAMPGMPNMDMNGKPMAPMPGMLTPEQMAALRVAKGAEFDRLFLTGMIQHHCGALIMVKALFDEAGAGQDADIFNFATDADNTQRAEIRIMQHMLEEKH